MWAHPDDPVRAVEAFFEVVLHRIADFHVPDGCFVAQSVTQMTPSSTARGW